MPFRESSYPGLEYLGITTHAPVHWNLESAELVEFAVRREEGHLSDSGAFIVNTGVHTGRSPKDKYIVNHSGELDSEIAWGNINKPFSPVSFDRLFNKIVDYLHGKELFIEDVRVGNHPLHNRTIRIITEKAWTALFSRNLLIPVVVENQERIDFTLLHVPDFYADPATDGTQSGTFIVLDFSRKIMLVGGTGYAGEVKKSIFTLMNRILPSIDVFPMHCSANIGEKMDTALFFGLSGTGKTSLSSSPDRSLIGDDEHGWCEDGIFNFEGGCYAKTINLRKDYEPEIWQASQSFGSVLENVGFDQKTRAANFDDATRTENTRAAYPLKYVQRHVENGRGAHPTNIFFLSADAFGVLPPISKLSVNQAIYYFLLGYTSKLAGTEKGLNSQPEATFSACFAEPFLPLDPVIYALLLKKKILKHNPRVWLINTGWTGGSYGIGSRIKLPYSRAMIRLALLAESEELSFHKDEIFNLEVPDRMNGIPESIFYPGSTWKSQDEYRLTARSLADRMKKRMEQYKSNLDQTVIDSGPN